MLVEVQFNVYKTTCQRLSSFILHNDQILALKYFVFSIPYGTTTETSVLTYFVTWLFSWYTILSIPFLVLSAFPYSLYFNQTPLLSSGLIIILLPGGFLYSCPLFSYLFSLQSPLSQLRLMFLPRFALPRFFNFTIINQEFLPYRRPGDTPCMNMLERLYYEKNRNRSFPCAQVSITSW